jgi:hypothetical protein
LVQSIPHWMNERFPPEIVLAVFVLLTFTGAALCLVRIRHDRFSFLLAPWFVLGLCSTLLVWGKPHNMARSFAIMWPLMLLSMWGRNQRDG